MLRNVSFASIFALSVWAGACTTIEDNQMPETWDADASATRPNIVLVLFEDMSPRVGAFGDELAVTPNFDKIAAEGVRYTNVFTTSGVCAPSRAA